MITEDRLDRRAVLKAGATLALASAIPSSASAQPAATVLRRSIGTMAIDDPMLDSYRTAIRAMKALSESDNRNWRKQAEIHANFCPHNNWYFLPWHRAYLLAFERISRELSGNPNFALPYWDWTSARQLPAAFTNPTYQGQPNPLYNPSRTVPPNHSLPDNMVGSAVIASLIAEPNFEIFGSGKPSGQNNTNASWQRAVGITGPLEGNPHNRIHGTLGGDMGSYMSPLDPIFWLHHCNVDRLWQDWREAGRSNPSDPLWGGLSFTGNFWQANGTSPYNVAVSALQDIASLGYRYRLVVAGGNVLQTLAFNNLVAPLPIQMANLESARRVNVSAAAQPNVVLNAPVSLDANQTQVIAAIRPVDISSVDFASAASPARVLAVIGDIDPPKAGNLDVRVFVNCDYLTPETPTTDPSYAGTFCFFGTEHAGHGAGKPSYLIDLTNAVVNLRRAQKPLVSQINVQLMPVPIPGVQEAPEFKPGNIRVAII